jgi:hypothetical protein
MDHDPGTLWRVGLTDSLAGTNMVGFEKILIAKPSDISGGG